jgi:hypothetical protein
MKVGENYKISSHWINENRLAKKEYFAPEL